MSVFTHVDFTVPSTALGDYKVLTYYLLDEKKRGMY